MNHYIIAGELGLYGLFAWRLVHSDRRIKQLEAQEEQRRKTHQQIFEMQSNPEAIEAEMNRNADFMEARNARRLTLPRPDAGSPAIVHRPPIRSVQPRTDREKFFKIPLKEVDAEKKED